jgi:hypothetical protein
MTPEPLCMVGALMTPSTVVVPGSVTKACVDCGRGVAIAPTGQARVAQAEPGQDVRFYCMPCGLAMMARDPDPTVEPVTQAQVNEMVNFLRRN